MSDRHTPGPMRVGHSNEIGRQIITDNNVLDPLLVATANGCLKESVSGNARLLAAAYTSYDKHCGPRAVECARDDLLGEALKALRPLAEVYTESLREESCTHFNVPHVAIRAARETIAKATGEKP